MKKDLVLIVEDDEIWRNTLYGGLCRADVEVIIKSSWLELLNFVRSSTVKADFLIADLSVGSTVDYGIDCLRMLEAFSPPKTLVLTSAYMENVVSKCLMLKYVSDVTGKLLVSDVEKSLSLLLHRPIVLQHTKSTVREKRNVVMTDKERNVFVVHGRNTKKREQMFAFLRCLSLNPIEWERAVAATGEGNPYIGDVVDAGMKLAQAIVVLFTGDDEVRLSKLLTRKGDLRAETTFQYQPRANVIFEAGFALAAYPRQTVIVSIGTVKIFSDVSGRHLVNLDSSPQAKSAFINRLETAGCMLDARTSDWFELPFD